ncbi:efflux RND transporter periplasmic adaptor subunit [Chitinophaga pendula]|uniref:efflux RND transporter periplasmic adaptor subunit n=1 Tax=Chitinophaga TaxID=79328 RepID=UPI000BAFB2C3|nr:MULTISPECIES: efflux RND transporter periplasmic adaptor subunit [Chitinophaga]ASZ14083.1 efflux transporter periplasmic adaptor subunit [Chitinophaga sp. MD30]UCJ08284.1 efflux RND transporter periplasmic adaptor subunit [Chitinophaga pendula]
MRKLAFIISSCGLLIACGQQQQEKKEQSATAVHPDSNSVALTPEQMKTAGIELKTAETKAMHAVLKVNGIIDVPPQNIVSVSMPMGGYLKTMRLLPGMKVSKGQILATLEDPQYIQLQQDYLVARSRLHFLETDFARQKELNESKTNSDKVFQQVRSEYESQRAIVSALKEKLQLININPDKLSDASISRQISIYAPISGYVTKVNVNTGRYVSPTDILLELIDPADLHLSLTVFEKDLFRLSPGQLVTCYTNDQPDQVYKAKVHLITPNVNQDRSGEVHCHFETMDKRLLPGMFMNATIELGNGNATAVPDDAVVKWKNQPFLFVAAGNGHFTMTPVETGNTIDGYTEIRTPLDHKQVVTKNAYALLMKMKNGGEE